MDLRTEQMIAALLRSPQFYTGPKNLGQVGQSELDLLSSLPQFKPPRNPIDISQFSGNPTINPQIMGPK